MRNLILTLLFPLLALLCGCSSPGGATLLGAGLGTLAGASIGMIAPGGRTGQYRARNVIIGGALGGVLGAGTGYVANEPLIDKSNKEAFEKGKVAGQKNSSGLMMGGLGQPILIPPQVESHFVDDQVHGNVFIPAHVEFIITQPARWTR